MGSNKQVPYEGLTFGEAFKRVGVSSYVLGEFDLDARVETLGDSMVVEDMARDYPILVARDSNGPGSVEFPPYALLTEPRKPLFQRSRLARGIMRVLTFGAYAGPVVAAGCLAPTDSPALPDVDCGTYDVSVHESVMPGVSHPRGVGVLKGADVELQTAGYHAGGAKVTDIHGGLGSTGDARDLERQYNLDDQNCPRPEAKAEMGQLLIEPIRDVNVVAPNGFEESYGTPPGKDAPERWYRAEGARIFNERDG